MLTTTDQHMITSNKMRKPRGKEGERRQTYRQTNKQKEKPKKSNAEGLEVEFAVNKRDRERLKNKSVQSRSVINEQREERLVVRAGRIDGLWMSSTNL